MRLRTKLGGRELVLLERLQHLEEKVNALTAGKASTDADILRCVNDTTKTAVTDQAAELRREFREEFAKSFSKLQADVQTMDAWLKAKALHDTQVEEYLNDLHATRPLEGAQVQQAFAGMVNEIIRLRFPPPSRLAWKR